MTGSFIKPTVLDSSPFRLKKKLLVGLKLSNIDEELVSVKIVISHLLAKISNIYQLSVSHVEYHLAFTCHGLIFFYIPILTFFVYSCRFS